MAQKRNILNTGKSPSQIERDIDETRSDMSETLDALSDRFDPDHLKDQALDQAKDFLAGPAADIGTTMLDTIKQHPVPALAAALSIGWLVVKSGESEQDRRFEDDYYHRTGRYPAPGYASYARRTGRRYELYDTEYDSSGYDTGDNGSNRSLADKASDKASKLADKAGDALSEAKHKAGDLVDQATDMIPGGSSTRHYRRQASNWLEQQLDENPMIVGAVALATGALVGLSVPETRQEDELMGQQSDRLIKQAKSMADEKIDQAKQVMQETAKEAKSKAKDVAETAKQEAKAAAKTAEKEISKAGSAPTASTSTAGKSSATSAPASPGSTASGMEKLEAKTEKVKAKASRGSGKK